MIHYLNEFFTYFDFSFYEGIVILIIPLIFDFIGSILRAIGVIGLEIYRYLEYKLYLFRHRKHEVLLPISVIIAAKNEEKLIKKTIENILNLHYPILDLIVVDDSSNDKTYRILRRYQQEGKIKLFRRGHDSGSKSSALNYGLSMAKHEIIVTVDADTELDRNALRELVKEFYNKKVVGVAGNIGVRNKKNLITKLQAYEYLVSLDLGRRWEDLIRGIVIIPGAFGAYRKEALKKIGGFDNETITEDFDTALKLHKIGKVVFSNRAFAWTHVPDTVKHWKRQRIRWSRGQLQTISKHKNMLFNHRFGFEGVFGLTIMVLIDFILLLVRIFYVYFIFVIYPLIENIPIEAIVWFYIRAILMTFVVYIITDLIAVITALFVTPHRKDLMYFFYLPYTVFFYRPYLSLMRLKGYIGFFTRDRTQW